MILTKSDMRQCVTKAIDLALANGHSLNYRVLAWRISKLTLCMLGNFSFSCCPLLTFFQNKLFQKILSGTLSECQTVWIQINTNILSVLIWVQTVCKCYQQTTKGRNVFRCTSVPDYCIYIGKQCRP